MVGDSTPPGPSDRDACAVAVWGALRKLAMSKRAVSPIVNRKEGIGRESMES
jgi:hypothetical protein